MPKNGMTALESCYPSLKSVLPEVSETRWVELLSVNPRTIFGLPKPAIATNEQATLTIFDPNSHTVLGDFKSRSKNSPFAGQTLNGKVIGILNKTKIILND